MLQVQEDILRAKSLLTVHKLTRNPLDIDAALEALETAYTSLENTVAQDEYEYLMLVIILAQNRQPSETHKTKNNVLQESEYQKQQNKEISRCEKDEESMKVRYLA